MAKITWENLDTNKLNKALKQASKPNVLVGPRASKGSYGDLANILQASVDKAEEKKKKKATSGRLDPRSSGKRGIGIAVKGGGRIL